MMFKNTAFIGIVLLVCVSVATLALAQQDILGQKKTTISNDVTNAFFEGCIEKPDPIMNQEDQLGMCACMAAQLPGTMTLEEYNLAGGKVQKYSKEYHDAWRKMVTFVYGPCLEFPVKVLERQNCMNNVGFHSLVTDVYATCECTARKVASYTSLNAPDLLAAVMHFNPHYEDPLQPLLESPEFMTVQQESLRECMVKYSWDNAPQ